MGRKKHRWRAKNKQHDFAALRDDLESLSPGPESSFDEFRRFLDTQIQNETKAFHELRTRAAKEWPLLESKRPELRQNSALAPASFFKKSIGRGSALWLCLIFAGIGFSLQQLSWQDLQGFSRKFKGSLEARFKPKMEANCLAVSPAKTKSTLSQDQVQAAQALTKKPREALKSVERSPEPMLLSYWVGTAVLNVREFPSASSRVLYQLKAGQELKGIPHGSEWLELGPNTSGYVARKLLVERKSLPQHGLLPMRVRVDQAEIHSGPGQQYPVLGLYFKHHKLEVEGLQGSWFRVGPDQYIREGELEAFQGKDSTQTM